MPLSSKKLSRPQFLLYFTSLALSPLLPLAETANSLPQIRLITSKPSQMVGLARPSSIRPRRQVKVSEDLPERPTSGD